MSTSTTHGFRLSTQQKRLWSLQHQSDVYRVQALVSLTSPIDIARLTAAIDRVIARHDILRTVFVREPGVKTPIQVIADRGPSSMRAVDISDAATHTVVALEEIASDDLRAPFDFGKGPLHRFTLVHGADRATLIITMPPLCADARSLEQLAREIVADYGDASGSREADDVVQYSQYTEWQHELLQEEGAGAGYWATQTSLEASLGAALGAGPGAALQAHDVHDADDGERAGFEPRQVALRLDAGTAERIAAVAQRHGAGVPAFLLTCWQALHARLSGEWNSVCGVLGQGRKYEELEQAIGAFAQHLPCHANLDASMRVDEALRLTERSLRAALEWEEYFSPGTLARGESAADVFIPLQFECDESRKSGVPVEIRAACLDRFRVRLRSVVRPDGWLIEIHYDAHTVSASDAGRLATRYAAIVESASQSPDATLGALDLMGPAERQHVLRDVNETAVDFDLAACGVHQMFEAQARRTPDAMAVVCDGAGLSYRALNERANCLAHHLRRRGLPSDAVVGVSLERSAETIVAILGIMKAGAAYLPIDASQPAERTAYMLRQAGASVVIDALPTPTSPADLVNPRVDVSAANLAYVIYTSGSTGQPKGVGVEHRHLRNYVAAITARLDLPSGSRYALVSTFNADLGHTVIFPALTGGGCLHVITEDCATDAERAGRYVETHAIDCLKIVPSHLNALLTGRHAARVVPARCLVIGGEASRWESIDRMRALAPACRILNHYGPTETTVGSLTCEVNPGGQADRTLSDTVPIGRPIANTRVYVLDDSAQPAPIGVAGELLIGGAGVARGYMGQPAWTAERFVPDAWSGTPGSRLYRTGDRARWRADDQLEFLGRRDHQVKVRGYRVELGEIESALAECAGVRQAVVVARPSRTDDVRLVAYVTSEGRSVAGVRETLAARLPAYMIPSAIVPLDRLPLTANGKVDRAALPLEEEAASDASYEAPRTQTEGVLAQIWADVLRLDRVSVHANFFALGGHSLLVTQVMSRVREVFRVDIPLRALFEAPTLASQAEAVEVALRGGAGLASPPVTRVPRHEALPLSFAQQRLWFLDQLETGRPLYNVPGALRLAGPLDVRALANAISEVVRRHEVLRTTFESRDGTAVQVVHAAARVPLPVIDLAALAADTRAVEARRLVDQDATTPFDLGACPPIRPRILRLASDEHLLLFTRHHIVSDEWSTAVLTREVAALYDAYVEGRPSPLRELEIQYADYAAWQRQHVQGEELERQLAYWRRQLADHRPLELPTDRPRSRATSFRGARHAFTLPEALSNELRALSRRESVTLFMTLLAAFQVLLGRYARQDDVSVGTPLAGRTRRETEGLIGPFVNTLLLRTDLSGTPSFLELLRRVRDVAVDAHANQDVPFERLVEETQPERDRTRAPLFQVMFTVRNPQPDVPKLSGLDARPYGVESGAAKFDLILALGDGGGSLRGLVEYNTDLFDPDTIARLAGHLEVLLAGIAADPERSIAALRLTTPEAREELIGYAGREAPHASTPFVHQLFERQAAGRPAAIAVWSGDRHATYHDVNVSANRLAHYLRARGVRPEVCVGICLEQSVELFVAMLAVLKAGGAYVPLDPRHPAPRISSMCETARVAMVLTTGTLLPAGVDRPAIDLNAAREAIEQEPAHNPAAGLDGHNAAYVIFTSGTTGRPKGVAIEHHALASRIASMVALKRLAPGDRVLQFNSPSADSSGEEIYPTLASGAALVAMASPGRLSAPELLDECERAGITVVHLPAAYWHELAAAAGERKRIPATLRQTFVGGERLWPERVHAWTTLMRAGDRFVNVYGPTEITITAATFGMGANDGTAPMVERVPIGAPLGASRVYVLDAAGEIQPVGFVGELHIGGEGVARGYAESPGLTAERFVPCVFEPDGGRVYRTGDLARYLPGGAIEFLGRADQQMRVRGYRVEPAEIEATLLACPDVRAVATVLREDVAGDPRLVTYVAGHPGERLDATRLRGVLERHLPGYMVPSAIVILDHLPLTINGKIDRSALPPPSFEDSSDTFTPPRTEVEALLAHLWADVLHRDAISVHGNFFELGGHSLLATRLISRVRAAFHVDIPLRVLFEGPTVAALARAVAAAAGGPRAVPPITPRSRREAPALSFSQQRLWFLDQLERGNPFYNSPGAVRLTGALDAGVLARALSEVVRRHEVLRTTFASVDRQPVQIIHPPASVSLAATSLEQFADPVAEAKRLAEADAREPFDLQRGPLVRLRLLRLAPDDHVLLFTMHHIVTDGWSMSVLFREVAALYTAFAEDRPSPLPDLAIQYADYAEWQREWMSGDVLESQVTYWKGQLTGAPDECALPSDRPRPAVQTYRGARATMALPEPVAQRLRELCRAEGATTFMVLLAGFQALLHHHTGLDDIVVGTDIANRQYRETEELIGFFINQLVMRTDVSGDPSFRALVRRVRDTALAAYAHQDAPFERIVEELQPVRDVSRAPLFQVKFLLQVAGGETMRLPGVQAAAFVIPRQTQRFDITVALTEAGSRIAGHIEYNTDLYDASTIERFVAHFERLLVAVTSDPETRLSQLSLLDPAERGRILEEWSSNGAVPQPRACVHEMIEAQAARDPDRVALVFERESVTYGALDRRSNQLARHLRELGVRPDVPVGLCVNRSTSMVIGLLAILKAGGAYVPLDPAYPASRLAFMLEQSRVPIMLTEDRLALSLPAHGAQLVSIDGDTAAIDRQRVAPVRSDARPDTMAYIIYTSGSTGQPKGTMVLHGGLSNLAAAQAHIFEAGSNARALQFASLSFDASIFEICLALCAGATLCVSSEESRLPGPDLVALLRDEDIDTVTLPPSVCALLPPEALPGLKTVIVAGEACPPSLVSRWAAERRFFNAYGPTETTVWATAARCRADAKPHIGRPVPNVECYLVDPSLQPVSIGVAGELLIGGAGVARGYLDRPDLTAERFIPDPFSRRPGARVYRTGDLARWLPDGNIDFLGRIDHQVKIRGYRIELNEIEAVLLEYPGVREAVAVARAESSGSTVAAYAVPHPGVPVTAGDLRAHLRERLPEYMVPAGIAVLDELPRTPNGKLDRGALPNPYDDAANAPAADMAPATDIERTIAAIWRDTLRAEHIDVRQNFFDIGGHSLLMVEVHARLRDALRRDLSLMDLFQYPTVRTLAEHLTPREQASGTRGPLQDRASKEKEDARRRTESLKEARKTHAAPAGRRRPQR